MLRVARRILTAWRRLRFQLWITEVRLRLWARGGKLVVEGPHGAVLEGRPALKAYPQGDGAGVLTLRFGRNVWIGRGMTIELDVMGDNTIELGNDTFVMNDVRLIMRSGRLTADNRVNIRDGAWVKVDGHLILGDDTVIGQYAAVHCTERIEFEEYSGVAERTTVLDSDHGFDGSDTYFRHQPLAVEPTTLGRNTFVAAGAVIMRGARIGRNCLVGSNSVVRGGDYPQGSLIAGVPAKVVQRRGDSAEAGSGN